MRVRIQNYQSIEDAEIEVEGFTVIVGKSNIGKSAVLRAIEDATVARSGNDFVQHGKQHCSVEVEDGDFHFLWEKGNKKNQYTFGTEVFDKVGTTAPPQIAEAGFFPVELNSRKGRPLSVQFASQDSGDVFLIDETPAVLAEVFSKLSKLDVWLKARKNCESDIKDKKSEVSVRDKDVIRLTEKLTRYEGLDKVSDKVTKLALIEEKLREKRDLISLAQTLAEERARVEARLGVLSAIEEVSVPEVTGKRAVRLAQVEDLAKDRLRYTKYCGLQVPEFEFTSVNVSPKFLEAERLWESRERSVVPEITFPAIPELGDFGDFTLAADLLESRVKCLELQKRLEDGLATLETQHEEFDCQRLDMEKELGNCPLCSKTFD